MLHQFHTWQNPVHLKQLDTNIWALTDMFYLPQDWSWPGTGPCQYPALVVVRSGGIDRLAPGPQSTLRTALHHAGEEPPEHAHTFGGHRLLQHTPEAWKGEREGGMEEKSQRIIEIVRKISVFSTCLTSKLLPCSMYARVLNWRCLTCIVCNIGCEVLTRRKNAWNETQTSLVT